MLFRGRRHIFNTQEVSFDEVLLDALNLSSLDTDRLEGKRELPINRKSIYLLFFVFVSIAVYFGVHIAKLQIIQGEEYYTQSLENTLEQSIIIAERGVINDRYGTPLAWNGIDDEGDFDFPVRLYTSYEGLGQLLGFVNAPRKDTKGNFFRTEYTGRTGVELMSNDILAGENGERFVERSVGGDVLSEHTVESSVAGDSVTLSIDAELTDAIYHILATSTEKAGFRSGIAALMDVHTGEMLAMTSYPSYDPSIFSRGTDREAITALNNDPRTPLLNKVIAGTYIPGSIVKPFIAYAALAEDVISPEKEIYSDGQLVLPNPYNPSQPSIFRDWRAQGYTDMRHAIKVSGDVYFYTIGGGFEDQEGLGIDRISPWMHRFGFGEYTGINLDVEADGVVPSREWKKKVFGTEWGIGDTYHTSIGQFGWQVTPIQVLRAYAALANGGMLVTPTVVKDKETPKIPLNLDSEKLQVIQDGIRLTVIEDGGTARGLEIEGVSVAGKSGTAEVDTAKTRVHTLITGYFPYEEPKYSFVLMMENGPYNNKLGASWVMRDVLLWIREHRPEYVGLHPAAGLVNE